jgi:hypothetical protein
LEEKIPVEIRLKGSSMPLWLLLTEEQVEYLERGYHRHVTSGKELAVVLGGRFTICLNEVAAIIRH